MLFNSIDFLVFFLPLSLLGFFSLAHKLGRRAACLWLVGVSLVFCAWWRIDNLYFLLASIAANWIFVLALRAARKDASPLGLWVLVIAVCTNVAALVFFKYANFVVALLESTYDSSFVFEHILLPLGISFYTFQNIALLADVYGGEADDLSFMDYCLFIAFFPKLIAGPIIHHSDLTPQFAKEETYSFNAVSAASGLTLLIVGLFKKVVIADGLLLPWTVPFFSQVHAGVTLGLIDAWAGGILFSLQLYFDFSAYSEMAVGIGLMFGVIMPFNFVSPFKATSAVDFWQRWHKTLTDFLTDYVFTPLTVFIGRRRMAQGKSLVRKDRASAGAFLWMIVVPVMVTMTLAGMWHGAGLQFVAYGVLLGIYLVINRAFRILCSRLRIRTLPAWGKPAAILLTFLSVVVALTVLRSPDIESALSLFQSQLGLNGIGEIAVLGNWVTVSTAGVLLAWCWMAPNAQEWIGLVDDTTNRLAARAPWLAWRSNIGWGVVMSSLALYSMSRLSDPTAFIYFNF